MFSNYYRSLFIQHYNYYAIIMSIQNNFSNSPISTNIRSKTNDKDTRTHSAITSNQYLFEKVKINNTVLLVKQFHHVSKLSKSCKKMCQSAFPDWKRDVDQPCMDSVQGANLQKKNMFVVFSISRWRIYLVRVLYKVSVCSFTINPKLSRYFKKPSSYWISPFVENKYSCKWKCNSLWHI